MDITNIYIPEELEGAEEISASEMRADTPPGTYTMVIDGIRTGEGDAKAFKAAFKDKNGTLGFRVLLRHLEGSKEAATFNNIVYTASTMSRVIDKATGAAINEFRTLLGAADVADKDELKKIGFATFDGSSVVDSLSELDESVKKSGVPINLVGPAGVLNDSLFGKAVKVKVTSDGKYTNYRIGKLPTAK